MEEGVGKHWHKQLIGAGVAAPRGQAGLEAFFFFPSRLMMVMNKI